MPVKFPPVDWTWMSTAPAVATAVAARKAFANSPMLMTVKVGAHKVKIKQRVRMPGFCTLTILAWAFIRTLAEHSNNLPW